MHKIKLKNHIYIGEDSLGNLLELSIYKDNDKYSFDISLLRKDTSLNNLKDNLEKVIEIKEENNKLNINLNVNNTVRSLGHIENNKYTNNIPLTNTEIRMLSLGNVREGNIFYNDKEIPYVNTDLHTHLSGVLNAKDIYEIGMKVSPKSVKFKISFLVGNKIIQSEDVKEEFMTLASLNKIKGFKERLINAMEIKPYKQITFTDMDIIYDIRGPFFASSDPKLFEAYMLKMGEDYSKKGVKYVEVAASSKMFKIYNEKAFEEKHKIIENALKKTKEKYGVDINLLIANPRSKTNEEDINQYLSIVAKCIKYPYIRGIDLLGHEKTSNKLYSYTFASVTRMCALHDLKYFTIRSHAGETRENTNNVKDFLIGIKQELEYMKENEGLDKAYIPDIRIGHGVYGIDEEAISLMKELNAKVEINASSNLALNNIYDLKQIPIRKYIDNEIEVVLGTDGQGIYLTDSKQESLIAYALGVSEDELWRIKEFEEDYVMNKNKETNKKKNIILLKDNTYLSKTNKLIDIKKSEYNY